MSKFVRIDKAEDPKSATLLNLDLVATVELSKVELTGGEQWVNLRFVSAEMVNIGSLHFKSVDQANRWALQHLGVEL